MDFIEKVEAGINEDFKVSVDPEKLNQQVLDHNKLESDIRYASYLNLSRFLFD